MATDNIPLPGCRPTPLASYLKALGVLRLVSEQSDPRAAGFWQDEHFHLRTSLGRNGLRNFFLQEYAPTPIIAPWNGRAGFLEGEEGDDSTREGAQLVRAYQMASAPRFQKLRSAAQAFSNLPAIKELDRVRARVKELDPKRLERGLTEDEKKEKANLSRLSNELKSRLIWEIRNVVDDDEFAWLDACIRVSDVRGNSPILVAGGADGSRDYGMTFGKALRKVLDFESGRVRQSTADWVDGAIFGEPIPLPNQDTFGHLQPGQGGYNLSVGFDGDNGLNPWDVVLALEGAVIWSGAVTRRLENIADVSAASFPFSFEPIRAGAGQLSSVDRNNMPGEIWCPLWRRPAGFEEIQALFKEGRLTSGRLPTKTSVDAALAVASLGSSRGISEFVRVGIYQSDAKMPHTATALARYRVNAEPTAFLAADLAGGRWLRQLRNRSRRKEASFELRAVVRAIDDALFEIATAPGEPQNVQAIIVAVGLAAKVLAARPKLWDRVRPPPLLSAEWLRRAYDDTPEFRIAAALAWLHAQTLEQWSRGNEPLATGQASASDSDGKWRAILPIRVHFAPLDRERALDWNESEGGALAVWGSGALIGNLCGVVQRRLVEQTRIGLPDKPFSAVIGVGSSDIAAFLEGGAGFDRRVADLLSGLCWVGWPDKEEREKLFAVWKSGRGRCRFLMLP
jgi:CRISPR-associated protein Csx17